MQPTQKLWEQSNTRGALSPPDMKGSKQIGQAINASPVGGPSEVSAAAELVRRIDGNLISSTPLSPTPCRCSCTSGPPALLPIPLPALLF